MILQDLCQDLGKIMTGSWLRSWQDLTGILARLSTWGGCRVTEDAINSIDEVIITDYFYCGFQYSAIIGLLNKHQE